MAAGSRMAIMNGVDAHPLKRLSEDARCTWFIPSATPLTARKRWIVGSLNPIGEIVIDDGAKRALNRGRVCCPRASSASVEASKRGDAVIVRCKAGQELAAGCPLLPNADAARIAGRKSGEIATILGYRGRDELIHRDDWY